MTEERIAKIERAIAMLEEMEAPVTNQAVFALVRGSYSELAAYLKERRAQASGGVAVLEEEPPRPENEAAPPFIEPEGVLEEPPTGLEIEDDAPPTEIAPPAKAPVSLTPMEVLEQTLRDATMAEMQAYETWARAWTVYKAYVAQLQRTPPQRHVEEAAAKARLIDLQERLHEYVRARQDKAQATQAASWAFYNAKKTARYILKRLHQAQLYTTTAPAYLRDTEQRKVDQLYTELVGVVGEAEAQRLVNDRDYQPGWLREG